jgi:predicted HD phosphohydrolase
MMYAILKAADGNKGTCSSAFVEELQQTYQRGLHYPLQEVQKQFRESLAIAQRAKAELAEDSLIAAALLYRPCQSLFTGIYSPKSWSSDSLLETGTYDWLSENFDSVVAETIRLQPHARRYLATVVGRYYDQLTEDERCQISRDGGIMSHNASVAFARGRYFTQSLRLARWINQVTQAGLDCLDIRHFERTLDHMLPIVSRAIRLI